MNFCVRARDIHAYFIGPKRTHQRFDCYGRCAYIESDQIEIEIKCLIEDNLFVKIVFRN